MHCLTTGRRRVLRTLLLLAVLTAALRGVALTGGWSHLSQDPDAYRRIAENLRQQGVYSASVADAPAHPTAFRPPLYPLVLAAVAWHRQVPPLSVAILHLGLGILTVWLTWGLARAWGLSSWSVVPAVGVACDPILLNQSAEVMTETLATLLAVAGILVLTCAGRSRASWVSLAAGIVLGLAILCRPSFLIWTALILLVTARCHLRALAAPRLIALGLGVAIVLAPWVIRNQLVLGRPILATTHGGYTLLLGNNRSFYRFLRDAKRGTVWDAARWQEQLGALEADLGASDPMQRARQADAPGRGVHPEIAADRRLYQRAWQAIRQEPGMFAYACGVRMARFWNPLPHQLSDRETTLRRLSRILVGCWYVGVFLLALLGLWQQGGRLMASAWVWGTLCVLALTVLHAVYWSNMRMRAPVMPWVYLVATVGGITGWCWVRRRKVFSESRLRRCARS